MTNPDKPADTESDAFLRREAARIDAERKQWELDERMGVHRRGGQVVPNPHNGARYRLRAVLAAAAAGFTLGASVLAFLAVSSMPGPAAAPAGAAAPQTEKPRAADAENIGAEIQRVDDWERGVSCYKVRGSDSIALQCLAMPADAPARATRLENVML